MGFEQILPSFQIDRFPVIVIFADMGAKLVLDQDSEDFSIDQGPCLWGDEGRHSSMDIPPLHHVRNEEAQRY